MATLVLRTVKGTPLTNLEVDGNFSNINTEVGVVFDRANTISSNVTIIQNTINSNIGILADLTTTSKSNLVSAINEIASESTSNVTISGGTIQGVVISNVTLGSNVSGGGASPWEIVSTNYTAADKDRLLANTAAGTFVITLPSSPTLGQEVLIADAYNFSTNPANVNGNGSNVAGLNEVLQLDVQGSQVQLVYDGNANWQVYYTSLTPSVTAATLGLGTTNNVTFGTVTATDFNSTSDITLKENVLPINDPLSIISQLNGIEFTWKETGTKSYGLSAQDVEKILPSVVVTRDSGVKGVNYMNLVAFLIEGIKELKQEIVNLKNKQQ